MNLEKGDNGHLYLSLVDDLLDKEVTDGETVSPLVPFALRVLELAGLPAGGRDTGK